MAAKITIRDASIHDVVLLARNLRPADQRELEAYGHGDKPHLALTDSASRSTHCWAGFAGNDLLAVFGVAEMEPGVGSPWMMGTPALDDHARALAKATPLYIARMLASFPHLVNFVHVENDVSIRWLKRVGFTVHPPQPYGAPGEMFHPFEMKA